MKTGARFSAGVGAGVGAPAALLPPVNASPTPVPEDGCASDDGTLVALEGAEVCAFPAESGVLRVAPAALGCCAPGASVCVLAGESTACAGRPEAGAAGTSDLLARRRSGTETVAQTTTTAATTSSFAVEPKERRSGVVSKSDRMCVVEEGRAPGRLGSSVVSPRGGDACEPAVNVQDSTRVASAFWVLARANDADACGACASPPAA
jgi:hypothetical protein